MNHEYYRNKRRRAVEQLVSEVGSSIKFLIPEALINWNIEAELPEGLEPVKARAFLFYIVNTIIAQNGGEWARYEEKIVPGEISSNILLQLFGKDYVRYRDFLQDTNIIRLRPYRVGKNNFLFQLKPDLFESKLVYQEIEYAPLKKKIKVWRFQKKEEDLKLYRRFADALYWYTKPGLSIDSEGATNYINKLKDREALRPVFSDPESSDILNLYNKQIPLQVAKGLDAILNLAVGNFNISIDPKRWRIYSTVTMMLSPLRNYLTHNGKTLVSIDIKNSQPFHFAHVLTERFWSAQSAAFSVKALHPDLFDFYNNTEIDPQKQLLKNVRKIVRDQPADVVRFKELVIGGELYEEMHNLFKEQYPGWHADRDASKQRFMQFLYFDLENKYETAYADYRKFEGAFPNVCFIMEGLKQRNYTDIATLLQRLESTILLYEFIRVFSDKHPEVPIYTVHDSIITLVDFKEEAEKILSEVYLSKIYIAPKLKLEVLEPQNALEKIDQYIDKKVVISMNADKVDQSKFQSLISRTAD